MVKKSEAEKVIRSLTSRWFRQAYPDVTDPSVLMPSFGDFASWARGEGYGHYFEFRSTMGPMESAELWFDQELKQAWRN